MHVTIKLEQISGVSYTRGKAEDEVDRLHALIVGALVSEPYCVQSIRFEIQENEVRWNTNTN